MNEIKNAARNQWRHILTTLGISADYLKNHHGPCPACGGKDRFRFDDKNGDGTFFCNQCGAGDGFSLLMRLNGWTFSEAKSAVSNALGGAHTPLPLNNVQRITSDPENVPDFNAYRDILSLWEVGDQVTTADPIGGGYIRRARGIPLDSFPPALRYARIGWMNGKPSEIGKKRDILLAAITNIKGDIVQVQAFLPRPDGKADKLYMKSWLPGAMNGCSIKLFEPTDTLAVGEGLETCLAWYCQNKIPAWSATSAGLMEAVLIPDSVTTVIALADNDQRGLTAAKKLGKRMLAEGRKFKLCIPHQVKDFADLYFHKGLAV